MGLTAPKSKSIAYKPAKSKNTTMSVGLDNNLDIHKLFPIPYSSISRWQWHMENLCPKKRTSVACQAFSYISSAFFGGFLSTIIAATNEKQPLSYGVLAGFFISFACFAAAYFFSEPRNVSLIAEEIKKDLDMITVNGDKNE